MTQKYLSLDKIFSMAVAKSAGTKDYPPGDVPFVTSSELNNGVVAYVDPMPSDKIFEGPAVAISGLGHATVHLGKFLPKGNAGDSLTILTPKEPLSHAELIAFAATFNSLHRWRFSFGRKCSKNRLLSLEVPFPFADVSEWVQQDIGTLNGLTAGYVLSIFGQDGSANNGGIEN